MAELPTGTVTLLLTDVEGSTPLWDTAPEAAAAAMAVHDRMLQRELEKWGGSWVKGTGDGALTVFPSATSALSAALGFQLSVLSEPATTIDVRVALHTGAPLLRGDDYHGLAVAECARVLAAIHGGQICLTEDTYDALENDYPPDVRLHNLGRHRLRGISEPVTLFQVEHPRLPGDFPPLRAVEAFMHNLPLSLTSFVGRQAELEQGKALVRRSRLVTLTGVGGSGKSRLAVELGMHLVDDFPDGVWIVELANLSEDSLVARSIGRGLGIPEERGQTDLDTLTMKLKDRRQLLILDNCEHLAEACAEVVEHLLSSCPHLKVLATSRQRLGLTGEVILAVPSMGVPRPIDLESPEATARADAVVLFGDRARLSIPEFEISSENCRPVGEICRAVEGIPLAVELAAGRVSSLPLDWIASHLTERIQMLGGGTGPARHRTLEETLEWSYTTLSPVEREVFTDLAVFRGGFELDAVDHVSSPSEPSAEPADVVAGLVEKSMILMDVLTGRYHYLEPVRLFAWKRLEASERSAVVRRRHALYVAEILDAVQREVQSGWMDRVAAEHDNVRAALRWALETGEKQLVVAIAARAWPFWKHQGHVTEGRNWLSQAVALEGDASPELLSSALVGAGDLAATQDDRASAERHLAAALEIVDRLDDEAAAAGVLGRLASLAHRAGELAEATTRFEDALAVARRASDLAQISVLLASLALLEEDQGRLEAAEAYAAEALSLRRRAASPYGVADALLTWGEIAINRSRYDQARRALSEADDIARKYGFRDVTAWCTAYRGKLELAEGNYTDGIRLLEDSLVRFQERGQPNGAAWVLRHLGRAVLTQGDLDRAALLLEEALDTALEHVLPDAPLVLEALGELEVARGDFQQAALLLSVAKHTREGMGLVLPVSERHKSTEAWAVVRVELGPERHARVDAEGSSTSLADVASLISRRAATRM